MLNYISRGCVITILAFFIVILEEHIYGNTTEHQYIYTSMSDIRVFLLVVIAMIIVHPFIFISCIYNSGKLLMAYFQKNDKNKGR